MPPFSAPALPNFPTRCLPSHPMPRFEFRALPRSSASRLRIPGCMARLRLTGSSPMTPVWQRWTPREEHHDMTDPKSNSASAVRPDPMRVRDLVGYGENPPDPRWPGGARIAVNFNLNVEGGG